MWRRGWGQRGEGGWGRGVGGELLHAAPLLDAGDGNDGGDEQPEACGQPCRPEVVILIAHVGELLVGGDRHQQVLVDEAVSVPHRLTFFVAAPLSSPISHRLPLLSPFPSYCRKAAAAVAEAEAKAPPRGSPHFHHQHRHRDAVTAHVEVLHGDVHHVKHVGVVE